MSPGYTYFEPFFLYILGAHFATFFWSLHLYVKWGQFEKIYADWNQGLGSWLTPFRKLVAHFEEKIGKRYKTRIIFIIFHMWRNTLAPNINKKLEVSPQFK